MNLQTKKNGKILDMRAYRIEKKIHELARQLFFPDEENIYLLSHLRSSVIRHREGANEKY